VLRATLVAAAWFGLADASPLSAQGNPPVARPPVPATSRPPGDSAGLSDSATVRRVRPLTAEDTIKTPLPAAQVPVPVGVRLGPQRWNREALFAQGALTLGELIAQVPGATLMTGGFLFAPTIVAWHGDPGGVRLIIDGIEREDLDPRNGGVTDFAQVPLWVFEEISLEETAGELRVHARTWRVDRTTASTRTDVLTGSENLNLFRGFFGKRGSSGVAIQLAAQQASTVSNDGMDGDGLGGFARIGWAAGNWSIDATGIRQGINRNPGNRNRAQGTFIEDAVPALKGASTLGYLRAAWRQPDAKGIWAQVTAASTIFRKTDPSASSSISTPAVSSDSGDTTASQAQYVASAGLNSGSLRLSGHLRGASRAGTFEFVPLARAEYVMGQLVVAGSAGRRAGGAAIWDVRAQASPFDWLRASASAGMSPPSASTTSRFFSSADVAVKLLGAWGSVGIRRVGKGVVLAPIEIDSTATGTELPDATAFTFSANVPIWRGWNAQTDVISWGGENAQFFRPRHQARSRLWFESSFLKMFPSGNFHVLAALNHDYRTQFFVPKVGEPGGQTTPAFSVLGTLLEIRISNAVISWDYRNMAGFNYETYPGYLMPRIASFYGIRWQFWN
jgi:hypothetical protein